MRRGGLIALGVVALLAVSGWLVFDRYAIRIPGLLTDWRSPIQPNQPVNWSRGPEQAAEQPGERPPNIVLILADDMGWNDISFYGGGVAGGSVPTPHIDAIAANGVHFSQGYAAHGTCAPSRAALMSGRYGTRFGFEFTPTPNGMAPIIARLYSADPNNIHPVYRPDVPSDAPTPGFPEMGMPQSEITLADLLQGHGYHTMHIGKWHLGYENGSAPNDQGFAESLNMASGLYLPVDDPNVVNSMQDFDPIDRFLWANLRHAADWNGGPRFRPDGYLTDYYTDQAVAAIEANRHRPFFLYLAHWAPHTPLQALKADYDALGHIDDHRERVYAAMMVSLDRGVGRVMEALREHGLEENTLVIFTSDNGGAGYLGLPEVNQPYRGWKLTFFEGGIRVPFFMQWPAVIPAGAEFDRPVHHFDIYATAASAAGVPLPGDRIIDGVDLLPYARRERDGDPHQALFWRSGHYQVVQSQGWKLQRTARPERVWLFDMTNDPTEQRELSASHPGKVAELLALLNEHNAAQVEPMWPSRAEMPVLIDKTLAEPQDPADEFVYVPN
ncbi:MAG: sulfatase-like hydrolase/transferase [Pseudomonadales bacterium]